MGPAVLYFLAMSVAEVTEPQSAAWVDRKTCPRRNTIDHAAPRYDDHTAPGPVATPLSYAA